MNDTTFIFVTENKLICTIIVVQRYAISRLMLCGNTIRSRDVSIASKISVLQLQVSENQIQ